MNSEDDVSAASSLRFNRKLRDVVRGIAQGAPTPIPQAEAPTGSLLSGISSASWPLDEGLRYRRKVVNIFLVSLTFADR